MFSDRRKYFVTSGLDLTATFSEYFSSMVNGFSDPGGQDAKRRLSRNLLSSDRKDKLIS